ncbi:MAG TPA: peptidoglycan DD-metalloendopeptidase family protein [Acidimicrobiia bacterium]
MRRGLGLVLVATLLAVSGTAGVAKETTTTTTTMEESTTTTTPESSTTTTIEESTTTTITSSTTVTSDPSSSTTTIPPATSTTVATSTPTIIPSSDGEHDPEPEVAEFKVGNMRPPAIVFPVAGPHSFTDTFGAPRDGGLRRHAGIDIFADKGVPVVAVADGVIEDVSEKYLAGQYVIVRHDDGWRSKYLHLDDDTPGTDDGLGTGYATGVEVGVRVTPGTVLGFVGDSGNAESTAPHLHFGLFQPNGLPVNPYPALARAPDAEMVPLGGGMRALNTELVGHLDPDLRGFNAGLAVNGDHVYMGTWGNDEICPGTGVRVIDVSDPEQPVRMTSFAGADEFPGTAADSIWVGAVRTQGFGGDVAVVGLRICDDYRVGSPTGRFAGFAIYDVNDPEEPILISAVHSGEGTRGAHDVDVISNDGQVLAVVTVPGSHLDHPEGLGDVRMYDLTDLTAVVELSDWGLRSDGPPLLVGLLATGAGNLSFPAVSASWVGPDQVIAAHSTAGLVTLDVSDPESPSLVALAFPLDTFDLVFGESAMSFGVPPPDAHDGWMLDDSILIQDDRRLEPHSDELGVPLSWGQQVFYNMADPANPRPIATFGTERSKSGADGEVGLDGFYSVRESAPFLGKYELAAWSSDGVRVVDIRDPVHPNEAAYFVPEPRPDPQGWWVAPDGTREMSLAWAAVSTEGFVYVIDANSGLWIVRVTIPPDEDGLPAPE